MRVAVLGAGPVGMATAAVLSRGGHDIRLVRPRGEAAERALTVRLAVAMEGEATLPLVEGIAGIAGHEVVVLAIPGTAYRAVLPALADAVAPGATVIFGGALPLAPVWLARRLGGRAGVIAWGTTLATASRQADGTLRVGTIRARFDIAPLPPADPAASLALCRTLFGDRFGLAEGGVLASALSNINPIAHAAQVLPNLSRIDRREDWPLFGNFTESACAICLALDAERLAVARGFGIAVRDIATHYHLSYHVPLGPLAGIAAEMQKRGLGPLGPKTLPHRYVQEDMPFGLAFLEAAGRRAGVPTPAVSGALTLLSAAVGQDLRAANFLLREPDLFAT